MSVHKMDSETVRADWRKWLAAVGAGEADVVVVAEGQDVAAVIPYKDYLELRDELIRLRADRKQKLEELAGLDAMGWEAQADEADSDNGGGDAGGGDAGDG